MIKKTALAVIAACLITTNATASGQNTQKQQFIQNLLTEQVEHSRSVAAAVGALISNYPEQVRPILKNALTLYPDDYQEIIKASIRTEPALCSDIVSIALDQQVASTEEILTVALETEPGYADSIVMSAIEQTPTEIENIVRIAVKTEPAMADSIIKTAVAASHSSFIDILASTFAEIPYVSDYLLEALIAFYPEHSMQIVQTAMENGTAGESELKGIVYAAKASGISDDEIINVAEKSGQDIKAITVMLNED